MEIVVANKSTISQVLDVHTVIWMYAYAYVLVAAFRFFFFFLGREEKEMVVKWLVNILF